MADEPLPPAPVAKEREHRHPLPLVIKIAEVGISIFIIGLIVDPFNANMKTFNQRRSKLDDVAAIYVATGGYMVINLVIIIGWLLGDVMPKKTMWDSTTGRVLYVLTSLAFYSSRFLDEGTLGMVQCKQKGEKSFKNYAMREYCSIIFSAVGSLLHIVAASLMVHNWRKTMNSYIEINNHGIRSSKQYNDMLISGAVFAYVNAVVFGIDV